MKQEFYDNIKTWFDGYVDNFIGETEDIQNNIDLKRNHSYRIVEISKDLGNQINLCESDILIVQTAALLHDVGRFKQLLDFGTFSDNESLNHTDLGVSILEENNVFSEISQEEKEIILEAIKNHHVTLIPKTVDKIHLPFVQIVRDADKIDVLGMVSDYYAKNRPGTNKRLEMELADKPEFSKKIYQNIMEDKVVDAKDVLTLNDLKILQMSWVFDLNFKRSFKIVSERTFLKQIYETLPKKDLVIDMYRQMKIYLENHL